MSVIVPNHFASLSAKDRPDMWVQEAIFGHRFIEEQKPFMLVLEVLSVCSAVLRNGEIFDHGPVDENRGELITASVAKRGPLRYLLFEDTALDRIKKLPNCSDDDRLLLLVEELNNGYKARTKLDGQFNYLKDRFKGKFSAFAQAVEILRSMEIDALANRRWSSRFMAPRGPHLLFSDIDTKFSSDRRFFGRGGEVAYLMLSRSKLSGRVAELVKAEFFAKSDPMDKLLAAIEPDNDDRTGDVPMGYLPLAHHQAYDRLAYDWIAVLGLSGLPSSQKFEPLFRLTALNLVRYFMDRAAEVGGLTDSNGKIEPEPIILDVSGGAISDMRTRSIRQLQRVRETIDEAVEAFIQDTLDGQPKWLNAKSHHDANIRFSLAIEAIEEAFLTSVLTKDKLSTLTPDACLSAFLKKATSRSRNNISTLIEPLGKNSGFISSRRGLGTWFDATDEFLEALVMANVNSEAITIDVFLSLIFDNYRIVIGLNEATKAFSRRSFDPSSFEENAKILERRLTGLGYVKRLSDDCAFVSNPYAV